MWWLVRVASLAVACMDLSLTHRRVVDVGKLVADPKTLSKDATVGILKDYNCEQLVWAADPEDAKGAPVRAHASPIASTHRAQPALTRARLCSQILVSSYGQVGDNLFVDPNTGRVLKFDHVKRVSRLLLLPRPLS
jgi:hypothetical protein